MVFLQGKAAIVTAGAGPGMGTAFSRALAGEGAAVVIADIDAGRSEVLAAEIRAGGGIALAVPTDVASGAAVRSLVERTVAEFGGIAVLVNHAGVMPSGRLEHITEAQWDRAIGVHLKGTFLCAQAVAPHMRKAGWGRIVSTASRAAYRPSPSAPGLSDYAAGKGGVVGFSRALAMELGSDGITVNVIAPGIVAGGGMSGEAQALSIEEDRKFGQSEGQVLPPRQVFPEEIAATLLHLVGPGADRITGQVIHVNGGSYFGG